jgi:hypothetical protein
MIVQVILPLQSGEQTLMMKAGAFIETHPTRVCTVFAVEVMTEADTSLPPFAVTPEMLSHIHQFIWHQYDERRHQDNPSYVEYDDATLQ